MSNKVIWMVYKSFRKLPTAIYIDLRWVFSSSFHIFFKEEENLSGWSAQNCVACVVDAYEIMRFNLRGCFSPGDKWGLCLGLGLVRKLGWLSERFAQTGFQYLMTLFLGNVVVQ